MHASLFLKVRILKTLVLVGISVLVLLPFLHRQKREVSSLPFPQHRATSDEGAILDQYDDYLAFAVEIGRGTHPQLAKQIQEHFLKLKKYDEKMAARFLKGLRYEMVQKLELAGLAPRRVTTDSAFIRRWVGKYLPLWLREVDEYQFSSFAMALAKRDRD